MNDTGLTSDDIVKIHSIFMMHKNVKEAVLYGSRAMGKYKAASDIDLILIGENIDLTELNEIENQLDDLYLPYKFDLSVFHQINDIDFLDHVKRVGKTFYKAYNREFLHDK